MKLSQIHEDASQMSIVRAKVQLKKLQDVLADFPENLTTQKMQDEYDNIKDKIEDAKKIISSAKLNELDMSTMLSYRGKARAQKGKAETLIAHTMPSNDPETTRLHQLTKKRRRGIKYADDKIAKTMRSSRR